MFLLSYLVLKLFDSPGLDTIPVLLFFFGDNLSVPYFLFGIVQKSLINDII